MRRHRTRHKIGRLRAWLFFKGNLLGLCGLRRLCLQRNAWLGTERRMGDQFNVRQFFRLNGIFRARAGQQKLTPCFTERRLEKLACRALLLHPATCQHDDMIRQRAGMPQVVRDNQYRHALRQHTNQPHNAVCGFIMNVCRGLVDQQKRRITERLAHDGHTIALRLG
ncbi:hypothetical protein SDC9_160924 [bioreactor metagenome]|uniref:Uncharacterized protein n=1 Tax=bioreactor metagenome TaxID=1076179 RepID=A0A645FJ94_9ZZZZ